MAAVFFIIAIVIFIFSPEIGAILSRIADNQMDVYKFIVMNRIMIFSLILMSMSGLATGILNSHNLFTTNHLRSFWGQRRESLQLLLPDCRDGPYNWGPTITTLSSGQRGNTGMQMSSQGYYLCQEELPSSHRRLGCAMCGR